MELTGELERKSERSREVWRRGLHSYGPPSTWQLLVEDVREAAAMACETPATTGATQEYRDTREELLAKRRALGR
eukprot:8892804-Pyramimonas_sp.AAC.1